MSRIADVTDILDDALLRDELAVICAKWQLTELALFGSAIRGQMRPDSDVDVLISFADEARPSLFDLNRISRELERIFERPVDVVTRRGIERGRNTARRDEILSTARPICGAA